jgi:hypothetical protein
MEGERKDNIYGKMLKITAELNAVAKNLRVGEGKNSYKATGEADILAAVKPLEEKYGVYSYPVDRQIVQADVLTVTSTYNGNAKETNKMFMRVETVYRFVNTDNPNEYIDIKSYGDGVDTQDKAPGKAMTYADKYALMKAYKIITGEDPDQYKSPDSGGSLGSDGLATSQEKAAFMAACNTAGVDYREVLVQVGVDGKMTKRQHGQALQILKSMQEQPNG